MSNFFGAVQFVEGRKREGELVAQYNRKIMERWIKKAPTSTMESTKAALAKLISYHKEIEAIRGDDPITEEYILAHSSSKGCITTVFHAYYSIITLPVSLVRTQAVAQLDNITRFLDRVERFHGAWAHWYASETEQVYPFSPFNDGGDLVETAFLTEGLIVVREWLKDSEDEAERAVAKRADKLWKEIEWDWYTQGTDSLYWHWSKNYGWKMNHRITGFDECFITYVLAASSPTHPIEGKVYEACYKNSSYYYNGKEYYGIPLSLGMDYGGPLFFTHYSWLGLAPRGLTDGTVNFFERNRAHALIHYNYALDNPKHHKDYGANLWGFTSSDDPLVGYCSHHPGTPDENGTVSPTAAISSIVYTPEQSMAVIRHLYEDLGEQLFGDYGFKDAFNLPARWFANSYLAIDQGPIIVMIENYRTGLIWNLMIQDKDLQNGLTKLGFSY